MDESKLIAQLSSGNPETFIDIMQAYNKLLWVIVGGVLKDVGTNEDIEECISDVYVNFWKRSDAYDARKGSLKTFLAVMAKRKALDKYRQLTKINIAENLNNKKALTTPVYRSKLDVWFTAVN